MENSSNGPERKGKRNESHQGGQEKDTFEVRRGLEEDDIAKVIVKTLLEYMIQKEVNEDNKKRTE